MFQKALAVVAMVAATLVATSGPPAQADTSGKMTLAEWHWVTVSGSIADDESGNTKSAVQDHCDCTGVVIDSGSANGNPWKEIEYDVPDFFPPGSWASVSYIKNPDTNAWRATSAIWCDDTCMYKPSKR